MKIRKAEHKDLPQIVKMLADDVLGAKREQYQLPLPSSYEKAFKAIDSDPYQRLVVAINEQEDVVATLQLSFIQYLTYQGGVRAQIEAVRVRSDQRAKNIGREMFLWAIEQAKQQGAHVVQLTTDKKRPDAIRFYNQLGFIDSHEGMKLHL